MGGLEISIRDKETSEYNDESQSLKLLPSELLTENSQI